MTYKFLIAGDLHLDDSNPFRYHNYWENCVDVLERYANLVNKVKPNNVFLAGDVIGLRSAVKFKGYNSLVYLCKYFKEVFRVPVVLSGNHDIGNDTAFNFFRNVGVMKVYGGYKDLTVITKDRKVGLRFHLVDYGAEDVDLKLLKEEKANSNDIENCYDVVIAHNDFFLEEQYKNNKNQIDLSTHYNWLMADFIVSGHIHTPSDKIQQKKVTTKHVCKFLNLGCATRTSRNDKYDFVNNLVITMGSGKLIFDVEKIILSDYDSLFTEESQGMDDYAELINVENHERLVDLVKAIEETGLYKVSTIEDYINKMEISKEVKKLAVKYIKTIMEKGDVALVDKKQIRKEKKKGRTKQ